jgi:hypothetical protein
MEEYKNEKMSKLIPFALFIDNYFRKKQLIKPPVLLELVAPAIFNQEYDLEDNNASI